MRRVIDAEDDTDDESDHEVTEKRNKTKTCKKTLQTHGNENKVKQSFISKHVFCYEF